MVTWEMMSIDCFDSAQHLRDKSHWRSCVSRSYYAVYAALTAELCKVKGIRFNYAGNNPSHKQLRDLVEHHLPYPEIQRREIKRSLNILHLARGEADYQPTRAIEQKEARDALREASKILRLVGFLT